MRRIWFGPLKCYRALALLPFQRTEAQKICAQLFEWPPEKTGTFFLKIFTLCWWCTQTSRCKILCKLHVYSWIIACGGRTSYDHIYLVSRSWKYIFVNPSFYNIVQQHRNFLLDMKLHWWCEHNWRN